MSPATASDLVAASPMRHGARVADRLLVWLPALTACATVALYLLIHRQLILAPAGAVLAALAAGPWSPDPALHTSFVALLLPPALLLAALAWAIWPWSRLYDWRPTLRLLATATLSSAALVLLQLALGAAGVLSPGNLALAAGGLATALLIGHRARRLVSPYGWRRHEGTRPVLTAGPFAGAAARLGLAPPTRLGLALGGLAAASWLCLAALGALAPPWGWDSLVYHLTDVFWFAQTGALEPFPHPAHQFHFPKVAELHALWFYLLSGAGTGSWRVAGIALLPLALTSGVAVRAAGELLGLRSALPWLAPATMLVPLALVQPLAGYTDLALTAFLLASFTFLLAALRRGRKADWAFTSLACGLALGSKLSFVYFCLPLLLLLAAPAAWRRLRPGLVLRLPLWILLFAIGCGYWLLPALLRTGNPLHPLAVTVGGHTVLDGPVDVRVEDSNRQRYTTSLAGWLVYPLGERSFGRLGYTPDNGFGPQFAAAWLTLPFALALSRRRRRSLLTRSLLAAPASVFAWLLFSPWEHPRYALAACGFALLGLAAVEEAASGGASASPAARRLLRSAVVVSLLFAAPAGLLAALPEPGHVVAGWRSGDWQPRDLYPLRYGPAGSAFNWIAERSVGGATVSFDSPVFVAPLFGWHGRNRVVYAASPADRAIAGMPLAGTLRSWHGFLESEGVDLIVVWHNWWEPKPRPTLRQRWIAARPEGFEELATFGRAARILELRPLAAAAAAGPHRSLPELAKAGGWQIEHASGAIAEVAADPAGGVLVEYRFLTERPDYVDLRFDLVEGGWSPEGRLTFELDAPLGHPLLWIYLKEADARRNCRFRIAESAGAANGRLSVELARPDARTADFAIRRVASLHLVLDDDRARRASRGSFRINDFRIEPAAGASTTRGGLNR